MSDRKTIDISVRGVPVELYERIKQAAAKELRGRGVSINVMTILLLEEAMESRERGDNAGMSRDRIEESIEALASMAA